jgi:hypothetical protein
MGEESLGNVIACATREARSPLLMLPRLHIRDRTPGHRRDRLVSRLR